MAASASIGGSTRLAGVIGWPISHSRSPQMHNAAYADLGLDWAYVALPVPPHRLAEALRGLSALGFAGVNVTIPHKEGVAALCDELSEEAARAGSVNTVLISDDGTLRGETTDGAGMLAAIGDLPEGDAVVLGAGGAARAAVAALLGTGRPVLVCARRPEAAERLTNEIGGAVEPWPLHRAPALIVNATPLGQAGAVEETPFDCDLLSADMVVCDLAYRADGAPTGLIAEARRCGARAVDGLDVLVGQGALAFRLFTGKAAPVEVMRASV
ncbi:MAG: shikimate dehydrogenase [Gaiellales bacterium]|nr:shikimate dehydrogenase [Gaiellales bacterium]